MAVPSPGMGRKGGNGGLKGVGLEEQAGVQARAGVLAEGPQGALGVEGGTRACRWDRGHPGHSLGRWKGVRLHPPGALRLWRGEWELRRQPLGQPEKKAP